MLEILSRPTQDLLNSNSRTAKTGYFDSNFSPLVQVLAEEKEKSGGAATAAVKETFTRFFDLLEEIREGGTSSRGCWRTARCSARCSRKRS